MTGRNPRRQSRGALLSPRNDRAQPSKEDGRGAAASGRTSGQPAGMAAILASMMPLEARSR